MTSYDQTPAGEQLRRVADIQLALLQQQVTRLSEDMRADRQDTKEMVRQLSDQLKVTNALTTKLEQALEKGKLFIWAMTGGGAVVGTVAAKWDGILDTLRRLLT